MNSNWVGAGHLKIGDKIKQADGTVGVVATVVTVQQTQEMFNLTVSEAHTFYVGQNGWLVHNTLCGDVNIDSGAAFALISQNSPQRGAIKSMIGGNKIHMTQTAIDEVTDIVSKIGGPQEQARLADFLKRVTVIPDGVSSSFATARTTGKLGANDIKIFGTGDANGLITITTDVKALRALQAQGINVRAIRFDPVPLTGK